jgi:hypothetical protein
MDMETRGHGDKMTCKVRTRCEQDVQYGKKQNQQADPRTDTHTHNEIDKSIVNAHSTTPLNLMISV